MKSCFPSPIGTILTVEYIMSHKLPRGRGVEELEARSFVKNGQTSESEPPRAYTPSTHHPITLASHYTCYALALRVS